MIKHKFTVSGGKSQLEKPKDDSVGPHLAVIEEPKGSTYGPQVLYMSMLYSE